MTAPRCTRRNCGEIVRWTTNGHGRAGFVCDACARNARGLCRDCPARLHSSRAMRCATCKLERERVACRKRGRAYYADPGHRRHMLAQQKRRRRRAEVRAAYRAWRKEWFAKNPGAKQLAQWKYRNSEKGRAMVRAARKRHQLKHGDALRARARAFYAANRDRLVAEQRERRARERAA